MGTRKAFSIHWIPFLGFAWWPDPLYGAHGSPESEQQQKSAKQTQQERKPRAKLIIIIIVVVVIFIVIWLGLPYCSVVVVVSLLASRGFCFWFCFFRSVCFVVSLVVTPAATAITSAYYTHKHTDTYTAANDVCMCMQVCVCVFLHLTRICIGSNCMRLDVDKQMQKRLDWLDRYRYNTNTDADADTAAFN